MVIDLNILISWLSAITAIIGTGVAVYKVIDKKALSRIKDLEKRMSATEAWTSKQQTDISEIMELSRLNTENQLACLRGLHALGCNGPVSAAIDRTQQLLFDRAHQAKSRPKQ